MENVSVNSLQPQLQPKELVDLYWNYYQLHAEQRFKILEFFISVEIVLIGGFITILQIYPALSALAGILSSAVALACYLLDRRTTNLLHDCRVVLRKIEAEYMCQYEEDYKLFKNIKAHEGRYNYSKIIRGIYVLLIFVGIVLVLIA